MMVAAPMEEELKRQHGQKKRRENPLSKMNSKIEKENCPEKRKKKRKKRKRRKKKKPSKMPR
jgi:hypothetical protein